MNPRTVLFIFLFLLSGCIGETGSLIRTARQEETGSETIPEGAVERVSAEPDMVVGMAGYDYTNNDSQLVVEEGEVVEFRNIDSRHTVTFSGLPIDRKLHGDERVRYRFKKCCDLFIYSRYQSPGPGQGMSMEIRVVEEK